MGSWRIGRQETGTLAMTLSFSKAKRTVLGAVAALTLGVAMVGSTAPAEAQWRGHWGGGWVARQSGAAAGATVRPIGAATAIGRITAAVRSRPGLSAGSRSAP